MTTLTDDANKYLRTGVFPQYLNSSRELSQRFWKCVRELEEIRGY